MDSIEAVKIAFDEKVRNIDQLVETPSTVGTVTLELLRNLKNENETISGFIPYKKKLDDVISTIEKIKDHKQLKKNYQVIYNQATVLMTSHFESFLADIFKAIFDDYSSFLNWPDKKMQFDFNMLNHNFSPSLGDIILYNLKAQGGVNFQDLQSTVRTFKDYLQIETGLNGTLIESIIEHQAIRHVIIHNSGIIDEKYLNQTQKLKSRKYNYVDQEVKLDEKDYAKMKKTFNEAVDIIVASINKKISDLIPF